MTSRRSRKVRKHQRDHKISYMRARRELGLADTPLATIPLFASPTTIYPAIFDSGSPLRMVAIDHYTLGRRRGHAIELPTTVGQHIEALTAAGDLDSKTVFAFDSSGLMSQLADQGHVFTDDADIEGGWAAVFAQAASGAPVIVLVDHFDFLTADASARLLKHPTVHVIAADNANRQRDYTPSFSTDGWVTVEFSAQRTRTSPCVLVHNGGRHVPAPSTLPMDLNAKPFMDDAGYLGVPGWGFIGRYDVWRNSIPEFLADDGVLHPDPADSRMQISSVEELCAIVDYITRDLLDDSETYVDLERTIIVDRADRFMADPAGRIALMTMVDWVQDRGGMEGVCGFSVFADNPAVFDDLSIPVWGGGFAQPASTIGTFPAS